MLRRRGQVSSRAAAGFRRAAWSTPIREPRVQYSVMMAGGEKTTPRKLTQLGWRREASRPASCSGTGTQAVGERQRWGHARLPCATPHLAQQARKAFQAKPICRREKAGPWLHSGLPRPACSALRWAAPEPGLVPLPTRLPCPPALSAPPESRSSWQAHGQGRQTVGVRDFTWWASHAGSWAGAAPHRQVSMGRHGRRGRACGGGKGCRCAGQPAPHRAR